MHLIDFLHPRDGTCSFPTCNQPSHRCDIEHCRPYDHHDPTHGGPTRPDNTALACHRHNTCKNTHGPWTYTINHDHSFTWTHHTGHNYTSRLPQRWTTPHHDGPDRPNRATKPNKPSPANPSEPPPICSHWTMT